MSNIIEVNRIKYIPRDEKKVQPQGKFIPRLLFPVMGMMINYSMPLAYNPYMPKVKKEPQRPDVSIIKEYGLIQLKKSNLSRSKRDWVVWMFEKEYKRID